MHETCDIYTMRALSKGGTSRVNSPVSGLALSVKARELRVESPRRHSRAGRYMSSDEAVLLEGLAVGGKSRRRLDGSSDNERPRRLPRLDLNDDIRGDDNMSMNGSSSSAGAGMTAKHFPVVDVPRFEHDDLAGIKEYFDREGYAVVASILNAAELETAHDLFWRWAESVGEATLNRHDESTWTTSWPVAVDGGIMPWQGSGQSEFAWFVRSRPVLGNVYASLWGTDKLLVSFDAISAWRPWARNPQWKPSFREADGGWFHVDQCPDRDAFECVQGLVDVLGSDAAMGGGFTVVPRSHALFGSWRKDFSELVDTFGGDDYFELPHDHACLRTAILPRTRPGDLVLWDSRTIHCSSSGSEPPNGPQLARLVSYVCFTPAVRADGTCLERRRRAVMDGTTTTHVPEKALTTEGMLRFYPGLKIPIATRPYEPPRLSLQWQLVDGTSSRGRRHERRGGFSKRVQDSITDVVVPEINNDYFR